jgi:GTPase SAR1 family protein
MLAHTFEIRVALLGNVSAGKTTVLNALFREKYGEVAMKRTTVGANFFYVHTKANSSKSNNNDSELDDVVEESRTTGKLDCSVLTDAFRSAGSILKEISEDNRRIREKDSDNVQEKKFDIEQDEEIVPTAKKAKISSYGCSGPDYHSILAQFYQQNNPAKVPNARKHLKKYKVSTTC